MYALYEKRAQEGGYRYRFAEHIHLFGCNTGYIPWLLRETVLSEAASEPLEWQLPVDAALRTVDMADSALIINLKPNSKSSNLSLYEVIQVFGYSASGWTPVTLYLRGLFVDQDSSRLDAADFVRPVSETDDPIFSMMYLDGTIRDGELKGRWTAPRPSSTNSVLLWPHAFTYFAQQADMIMKHSG